MMLYYARRQHKRKTFVKCL